MTEESYEVKQKKDRKTNMMLIVIIFLFTITCCGTIGFFYHKSEMLKMLKSKSEDNTKMADLRGALAGSKELIRIKTKEVEKMKIKIAGIKDRDDLLKRDIEIYIDTTYPKVPKVVLKSIAENIVDLSRKHKVSPELVIGIIRVESYFNPMAVGPKTKYGHARGLMQVIPEWAPKLGFKNQYDFHDVDKGIEAGIRVFLIHLEEHHIF